MEAMENPENLNQQLQQINIHHYALIQIHGLPSARKYHSRASTTHQLSICPLGMSCIAIFHDSPLTYPNSQALPIQFLLAELFLMIFHANLEDSNILLADLEKERLPRQQKN